MIMLVGMLLLSIAAIPKEKLYGKWICTTHYHKIVLEFSKVKKLRQTAVNYELMDSSISTGEFDIRDSFLFIQLDKKLYPGYTILKLDASRMVLLPLKIQDTLIFERL